MSDVAHSDDNHHYQHNTNQSRSLRKANVNKARITNDSQKFIWKKTELATKLEQLNKYKKKVTFEWMEKEWYEEVEN